MTEQAETLEQIERIAPGRGRGVCRVAGCEEEIKAYFKVVLTHPHNSTAGGLEQKAGKSIGSKSVGICEAHAVEAWNAHLAGLEAFLRFGAEGGDDRDDGGG